MIVVCGESIWVKINHPHVSLIKSNTSNYLVYLQIEWALLNNPSLIVIQTVPTDRTEWIEENKFTPSSWFSTPTFYNQRKYTALNIKYSGNHHFINNPKYMPFIESCKISEIEDSTLPVAKRRLLRAYMDQFDPEIRQHYDMGIIAKSYFRIKAMGIPCLILLDPALHLLKPILSPEDITTMDRLEERIINKCG